jgi:hypothetical protein
MGEIGSMKRHTWKIPVLLFTDTPLDRIYKVPPPSLPHLALKLLEVICGFCAYPFFFFFSFKSLLARRRRSGRTVNPPSQAEAGECTGLRKLAQEEKKCEV